MVKQAEQEFSNINTSQELDIRDLFLILKRNKLSIILTSVIATLFLSLFAYSRKTVYEGRQLIYVNQGFDRNEILLEGAIAKSNIDDFDKNTFQYIKYCSKVYSPTDVYNILLNQEITSRDVEINLVRNSNMIELKMKSFSKSNLSKDFDFVINKYQKAFINIFNNCKDNKLTQFKMAKSLLMESSRDVNDINNSEQTNKLLSQIDKKIIYLQQETYDNNSIEIISNKNITIENKFDPKYTFLRSFLISIVFAFIVVFLKEISSDFIYDDNVLKKFIKFKFLGSLRSDEKNLNTDLFRDNLKIEGSLDINNIRLLFIDSANKKRNNSDSIFEGINLDEIKLKEISKINHDEKLILIVRSFNLRQKDLLTCLNQLRNKNDKIVGWYLFNY